MCNCCVCVKRFVKKVLFLILVSTFFGVVSLNCYCISRLVCNHVINLISKSQSIYRAVIKIHCMLFAGLVMVRSLLRKSGLLQNTLKTLPYKQVMTHSQYDYVKSFEIPDPCLPNCWPVVRIDGKNFHKFSTTHNFEKPNDDRALKLMTAAATSVMDLLNDIVLAYGQSDEYSFVFKKKTKAYNRRSSKLSSVVVSQFSTSYVYHWKKYFPDLELQYPPAFDSRLVLYPSDKNLRDYLSWRQVDCHINNMYNYCFWKLVQSGLTHVESQERLKGTLSGDKNELLFSQFGINYNNLPQLHRKGTVIIRDKSENGDCTPGKNGKDKVAVVALNTDIIGKQFWEGRPHLLAG
uniref:probable tRNA(His) guanylyltransferase isoform X2 n=1 Tax=Ciona intestinalis TaxID=7719 RepID=UPI00089DC0EA|nr:probable tRNA(His) guanylyltransferase isoform X2 [Ciona intestinalis]|eukprot:XP_002131677.4 probable tRNA(His) guanylyltransferase isoform X2 [Ciona intestinalis]